ncbi:hypothetical protein [Pseudoalteromonas sp. G4]|uniref:hypothetical protein n=1 Tax=Pseudoalteromonas sp. G4 TaxID=2992761 RepID=UPI00237DC590|nr:hypothetical protein [Pseudoalteromonas sp. G4]MDE3271390.1 hypothetical protein [Pseudoalteromonas sp. G4]
MKLYALILGLFIFNQPLLANNELKIRLAKDTFYEEFNADVPVSGRVITGVLAQSNKDLTQLNIMLPSVESDSICLKAQSIDGTYYSSNEYKLLTKNIEGPVYPDYPTKYKDQLSKLDRNNLALLAFPGDCSNNKPDTIFLSAVGEVSKAQTISILVNSGRSNVFINLKNNLAKHKTQKCQRIEQGKRTAYDTICNLNLDSLSVGKNSIAILRRKSGRSLPSVKLNLMYRDV